MKKARVYFYNRVNGKKKDIGSVELEYSGDISFEELRRMVILYNYCPSKFDGIDIVKADLLN